MLSWSKFISQWHCASRNANPHDEIPNNREWPNQCAGHKQTNWTVGNATLVTPQVDMHGIKSGDPSRAKCGNWNKNLTSVNAEYYQKAGYQTDSKPTFRSK